jgi:hypothetical protein
MAKKVERFKRGRSVSGDSVPLQNLDYNLVSSGSGSGSGGSGGFRVSPAMISQPSSPTASIAGQGPPKGYGFKFTRKFKKGGKLTDLTGDGKVTRADVLKGRGVPGFKKGGSAASKRADGCATKGKTKGRFV